MCRMIVASVKLWRRLCLLPVLLSLLAACVSLAEAPTEDTAAVAPTDAIFLAAEPELLPTPVDVPVAELLTRALEQRAVGDDDGAAATLQTILVSYPDAPEARTARYYIAESFARRGRWTSATEAFQSFLSEPAQDDYSHMALFWLARSYEEAGDWPAAIATYDRYRALHTPLEPYAAMRQAAQRQALGQLEEAARDYEYAAAADVQPGEQAGSYEKAIALRLELGQPDEALRLYEALLQVASLPDYRARLLLDAAALAAQSGQYDQSSAWLREIVTTAPATPQALSAVQQLAAANDPLLPAADAAQVFFMHEHYQSALPWFDAAVGQTPADSKEALELQRLRALTRRTLDDFDGAFNELSTIASASPDSEPGKQARLDWIQTLGQSGEVEQAARQYQDYARIWPNDWRAPVALDRAAQLYERLGNSEQAMQVRLELGQRYPQNDLAPAALINAAWYFFHGGRLSEAQNAWQLLTSSSQPYERARGAFWAGRIARSQQNEEQARALFELARAAAPNSYYGFRATEELGIVLNGSLPLGAPLTEDDWQTVAAWVSGWTGQPVENSTDQTPLAEVRNSGFVQRAIALQQVGLRIEAIGEWNSARTAWAEDPIRLLMLARLAHEHQMPYIALKTAEQLEKLAPQEMLPPPEALERLIFPAPYATLIIEESRSQGIDPRLFYALVRQESLFNPGATSWVGARGLAQIMPTTGEGIAQNLGVSDFQLDDLYRPQVSVRFGVFYLGQRLKDMEGSVPGALSAYNGGLGNALRWANGSSVADADLFTESIDFFETRDYVKRVYGNYGAYQRLYSLP